jgi:hypothetical protein
VSLQALLFVPDLAQSVTAGPALFYPPKWTSFPPPSTPYWESAFSISNRTGTFSRKSRYFFVRPKRNYLEVCVFLGRAIKAAQIQRVDRASKTKLVHFIRIRHRDEVEAPITDWLQEAYEWCGHHRPELEEAVICFLRRLSPPELAFPYIWI